VTEDTLRGLVQVHLFGLSAAAELPAGRFLLDRIASGAALPAVLIELVESDIPLDPYMRQIIAGQMREHLAPNSGYKKRQLLASYLRMLKWGRAGRGKPKLEIELDMAEELGITLEALRKRMQARNRKRKSE
jgi:hypothetical protein